MPQIQRLSLAWLSVNNQRSQRRSAEAETVSTLNVLHWKGYELWLLGIYIHSLAVSIIAVRSWTQSAIVGGCPSVCSTVLPVENNGLRAKCACVHFHIFCIVVLTKLIFILLLRS